MSKDIEIKMQASIEHLEHNFAKLRTGRANANVFEDVKVDYYGEMTAIQFVATIQTPEPRQFLIKPYEKDMVKAINKAIIDANLGFNPVDKGESLVINIPPLNEEKRKEYVKQAEGFAEQARVAIRNIRRDAMEAAKEVSKDKDAIHSSEAEVQKITDKFNEKVASMLSAKVKELMTL